MRIAMCTNTYLPHVGGVARSVHVFAEAYRALGHEVMIVAPAFDDSEESDPRVLRIPAIQNFNGSDFSVRLPVSALVLDPLEKFQPEIIHSHHPFLLGDTALRLAHRLNLPLVFTHHTMYERYTHYVPGDSVPMKQFAIQLATSYANLCNLVFAPSESIRDVLIRRGVEAEVRVMPTGIDLDLFALRGADSVSLRTQLAIPPTACVVGHVGRIAPEKNLPFLAAAVARFLQRNKDAHFVVVGGGPSLDEMRQLFAARGLAERFHAVGVQQGAQLVEYYQLFDVFAFTSTSETQGLVLLEAMACGTPVVALDAPGAREVVIDHDNGLLLYEESEVAFAEALEEFAQMPADEKARYRENARAIAESNSIELHARAAIREYQDIVARHSVETPGASDLWEHALRVLESEWDLFSATSEAAAFSIRRVFLRLLRKTEVLLRAVRALKRIRRSDLSVRMLNLEAFPSSSEKRGLILIQIDGLSRQLFERALVRRRMPFLRRLLTREGYRLHSLYSGLPSTTPAVQAEILYGRRTAVPGFGFYREDSGQRYMMFEPGSAFEIEEELKREGRGLLDGGVAYSIIYNGAAAESHFCPSSFGWSSLLRSANPLKLFTLLLFHFYSVVRVLILFFLELLLAIVDCVRGAVKGRDLWNECKFIPARVGISIVLRELLVIGSRIDISRRAPILYLNFLGYDEQAHRRGPSSAFALWSLKGLDDAIKRIWTAAKELHDFEYDVWIFSDHGQEESIPYVEEAGETLERTLSEAFEQSGLSQQVVVDSDHAQNRRAHWLFGGELQPRSTLRGEYHLASPGPLAHLYLQQALTLEQRKQLAARLSRRASIPIVLLPGEEGKVFGYREGREHRLPQDTEALVGYKYLRAEEFEEDIMRLCGHPDSGTLILCGWRPDRASISFSEESGAHGGMGKEETHAFALLPQGLSQEDVLRPSDLRALALSEQGRQPEQRTPRRSNVAENGLRVLTYNIHSAIDIYGNSSLQRIAQILEQQEADVIALQEVDVGLSRSGGADQVAVLAERLGMKAHFHSVYERDGGFYGNAVLSRQAFEVVRSGLLAPVRGEFHREPRGVMWLKMDFGGTPLHIFNTHLGFSRGEQLAQLRTLLGEDWLAHPEAVGGLILCGDFNFGPRSALYRRITRDLQDSQSVARKPQNTWTSKYPIRRLDYVFVNEHLSIQASEIPQNVHTIIASDHLPVICDLEPLSQVSR